MKCPRLSFVQLLTLTIAVTLSLAIPAFAAGPSEFFLYQFPATHTDSAGCMETSNLISDSAGNLYGLAGCGVLNHGIVFELVRPTTPNTRWKEQILYNFTGGSDGGNSDSSNFGAMTFDAAGNLYGQLLAGGSGHGVVFRLAPPVTPGGSWTESVIHTFQGGSADGSSPFFNGVVLDAAGNLYGETTAGGVTMGNPNCKQGCGVVYKLTPPTTDGAEWSATVIHSFNQVEGSAPFGTPTFDSQGNLYGTSFSGGAHGGGVAYRLLKPTTEGGAWNFKVLCAFGGTDDSIGPSGALTFHGPGHLYGTLTNSNRSGFGAVFELVPPTLPGGAWRENIIYRFTNGSDGSYPTGKVVFDRAGNLYGTAQRGGVNGASLCGSGTGGCGTVFELTPSGGAWSETTLHSFPASSTDAKWPFGGLILAPNGVLIGVATSTGGLGAGAVFGVVP